MYRCHVCRERIRSEDDLVIDDSGQVVHAECEEG